VIKNIKIDFLFQYPGALALLILKIISAIILFVFVILNYNTFIPLLLIAILTLLFILRSPQSNDGSDQMASILVLTCALAEGIPAIYGKEIAIAFVVGESSLSYATSGFLKLTKIGWQNGNYVIEILKTSSFGNKRLLHYVQKRKWIAKCLGCFVAYGDTILAFSFLFPPRFCLALLGFGIMLHIGIGIVMGLNNFLWSFCACYPAIYFVSLKIYDLI